MELLVGVDEAGYGPNLGPLVVSATVWRSDHDRLSDRWSERLAPHVVPASAAARHAATSVVMDDSKRLYQPARGVGLLERGVLAAIWCSGLRVESSSQLWATLDPAGASERRSLPWYAAHDCRLPQSPTAVDLPQVAERMSTGLRSCGVEIVQLASVAVEPAHWNQLLQKWGSKGTVLTQVSLQLVRQVIDPWRGVPIRVVCDKHGGRNCYAAALQHVFPETRIQVGTEGRASSHYSWGEPGAERRIQFRSGGEAFLPTALASMTSKYLRELAMQAFNRFWQAHQPQLRPTAGYPVDARRFKAEIAPLQSALGISDQMVWRER